MKGDSARIGAVVNRTRVLGLIESGEIKMSVEIRPFTKREHVHLVGIGGTGLSAIARLLCEEGFTVSGSDRADTPVLRHLRAMGAHVAVGHRAQQVAGADLVLISSAIPPDNPEVQAARRRNIPVLKRSQFLARLLVGRDVLAVAGTHGKTTTTGMIVQWAHLAGRQTGYIVGADLPGLGNAAAGDGHYFVIEADEYDNMFLGLQPHIIALTTVDWDHVDCFPTLASYRDAFRRFVERLPLKNGKLVASLDDAGAAMILSQRPAHLAGIGCSIYDRDALWQARDWNVATAGLPSFVVWRDGKPLGRTRLAVPGRHNMGNALVALAALDAWGMDVSALLPYVETFRGAARRFQRKGAVNRIEIYDDYAHHPAEVKATLHAARDLYPDAPLWVLFQPHTYSRTAVFLPRWVDAFALADHVLVTDIYAARETDTLALTGQKVAAALDHPDVRYVGSIENAIDQLVCWLRPGDLLLTMGAGSSGKVGEAVLKRLRAREGAELD